jgi:hypothetical protein
MGIHEYAAILLVIRVASMTLMASVLRRQLQLFKLYIDKEIAGYRRILFALATAIFVGNIIPAGIDALTLFSIVTRSAKTVNGISLLYTLAWATTSLLSSILIFRLYRMSHTVDETHAESEHVLTNDDTHKK